MAPGMVAASIFGWVIAWNEFQYANILTNNADWTVPIWLYTTLVPRGGGAPVGTLSAASLVYTLPVRVFFLLVQGRLSAGMTAGAVKA